MSESAENIHAIEQKAARLASELQRHLQEIRKTSDWPALADAVKQASAAADALRVAAACEENHDRR